MKKEWGDATVALVLYPSTFSQAMAGSSFFSFFQSVENYLHTILQHGHGLCTTQHKDVTKREQGQEGTKKEEARAGGRTLAFRLHPLLTRPCQLLSSEYHFPSSHDATPSPQSNDLPSRPVVGVSTGGCCTQLKKKSKKEKDEGESRLERSSRNGRAKGRITFFCCCAVLCLSFLHKGRCRRTA